MCQDIIERFQPEEHLFRKDIISSKKWFFEQGVETKNQSTENVSDVAEVKEIKCQISQMEVSDVTETQKIKHQIGQWKFLTLPRPRKSNARLANGSLLRNRG